MEENKKLDDFIKKSIQEVGLEKPSLDFTDLVLSKIAAESEISPVFHYQPILSKSTWFIILGTVASIFGFVFFGNPDLENTMFSFLQLNKMTAFNILGEIPSPEVSNTFIYSFLIFAIFVIVQVFMIKQRLDRQYDMS